MARHHLEPRLLEGTGWEGFTNGVKTSEGGIYVESNRDASCFSIRSIGQGHPEDEDLIHFCDWRELVKTIGEFMAERERIAREDGEWHG